jgi:hypothetical protein
VAMVQRERGSRTIFFALGFLVGLGFFTVLQDFRLEPTSTSPIRSSSSRSISKNTTQSTAVEGKRKVSRVKFVPFPYRHVGTGNENAGCNWVTGSPNEPPLDIIQQAAYNEGICLPHNEKSRANLHVFSTAEAIECLSPVRQGRDIRVLISGDSYNRQLLVGLADILLGRPWNVEILEGKQRNEVLKEDNRMLRVYAENDPNFPRVQFECYSECFGKYEGYTMSNCTSCFNHLVKENSDAVVVVGTYVHVLNRKNRDEAATYEELWKFIEETDNLLFNSPPSYDISTVPAQYQNASHNFATGRIYDKLLPIMAPYDRQKPFLDYYQLTQSCNWDNCSTDGGHRSRFVNRWKAQLLLNTICAVEEESS